MSSALTEAIDLAESAGDVEDPILDAAMSAFLDFGVRRTTMGEIARRAGISPATLYRRYAQKSDVVMGVGLRDAARTLQRIDDAVDQGTTPLEQLTAIHLAAIAELSGNDLVQRVLATEPESVLPRLTIDADAWLDIGRAYIGAFLTRLQDEGHLPRYDVDPVADCLVRLVQSEVLTPSRAPLTPQKARTFVRDHLAPFIRLDTTEGNSR